jgi:hypothetical protein
MRNLRARFGRTIVDAFGDGANGSWHVLGDVQNCLADVADSLLITWST